jgi:hypothetical protein
MKTLLAGLGVVVLMLAGCSKAPSYDSYIDAEPADADDQQAAYPAPPPPPVHQPLGDAILRDLDSIPLTLENQDYNTAINQLGAMGQVQGQMTDAQRKAYQQQLWQAQEYLREQAKRDASAQEAYERLGRQMMGR